MKIGEKMPKFKVIRGATVCIYYEKPLNNLLQYPRQRYNGARTLKS
jgi:hypothetical protein